MARTRKGASAKRSQFGACVEFARREGRVERGEEQKHAVAALAGDPRLLFARRRAFGERRYER